ncbi:hypothetical protein [Streptomyces cacaoi]|uniref:Uncharacterized protein n=1 Tax=Streptomyces cacaoi TaxID=1898 RepID=A0A4Y3QY90_STRCI|nr:hypothetical protein [Streptomyces cacaoi]GEB50416.1 hypothetical protein SCA03_29670 [Streptomyces cacaoi]
MREFKISENARRYLSAFGLERTAQEFIEEHGWKGFAIVEAYDGSPLPWEYELGPGQHTCRWTRDRVNSDVIVAELSEFDDAQWNVYDEFRGMIAYDYSREDVRTVIEGLERVLSEYSVLDDEERGDLLWEEAAQQLLRSEVLPPELEVEEVLDALCDRGVSFCQQCESWPIKEIVKDFGHQQCEYCNEWIETHQPDPLCYDCAREEADTDCDCQLIVIAGAEYDSRPVTRELLDTVQEQCPMCGTGPTADSSGVDTGKGGPIIGTGLRLVDVDTGDVIQPGTWLPHMYEPGEHVQYAGPQKCGDTTVAILRYSDVDFYWTGFPTEVRARWDSAEVPGLARIDIHESGGEERSTAVLTVGRHVVSSHHLSWEANRAAFHAEALHHARIAGWRVHPSSTQWTPTATGGKARRLEPLDSWAEIDQ